MFIKQLSVFIENKEGRLAQVSAVLKENNINIVSLSLADTSEYGLLRMVVSDPMTAKTVIRKNGYSAMLTDVIAVKLAHRVGMLEPLLKIMYEAGLNIEYMYVLSTNPNTAAMIIKTSDGDKALQALRTANMEVFDADTAYSINA